MNELLKLIEENLVRIDGEVMKFVQPTTETRIRLTLPSKTELNEAGMHIKKISVENPFVNLTIDEDNFIENIHLDLPEKARFSLSGSINTGTLSAVKSVFLRRIHRNSSKVLLIGD